MRRPFLAFIATLSFTLSAQAGGPDHSTPRRTAEAFQAAQRAGDAGKAADCLDLRDLPVAKRADEGPALARQLARVLDKTAPLDPTKLSDEPAGDPMDGPGSDIVGGVSVGTETVPIALTRVKTDSGTNEWLFSRSTVAAIPSLFAAHGEPFWVAVLPSFVAHAQFAGQLVWQWIGLGVCVLLSLLAAELLVRLAGSMVRRAASSWGASWTGSMVKASRGLRILLASSLFRAAFPPLGLTAGATQVLSTVTLTLLIFGIAAFVIRTLEVSADAYEARLPDDTFGELETRGVRTQLAVARKIASIVVAFIAASVTLLQFEVVRSVGMSLLASAGVLGVIVGIAAQRSLGGVIAGIQLSITQPFRIGDLVVMENETGIIEDITLTFVVVRLLDERSLIVPIARVIEQPFQNWTRPGPELLASVQIPVDLMTPVSVVRDELARIVDAHALWDRRASTLQVVDATEKSLTLRATVSVARASDVFALRADVREKLVAFLQAWEGGRYLFQPKPSPPPSATPNNA